MVHLPSLTLGKYHQKLSEDFGSHRELELLTGSSSQADHYDNFFFFSFNQNK